MKLRRIGATLGIAVLSLSLHAQQPPPVEALDGVDPVLLLKTGKETFGKAAFSSTVGRLTYLFASAESKAEFDAAPEKFAVQLNGACARMGGAARGNPSNYAVVEGKIYLFASDDCRTRFIATPARFIPPAVVPLPADAAAVSRGQALLEKAAAAHGGAKIDALTSYVEAHKAFQPPGSPAPPADQKFLWRFPEGARMERRFVMPGDPPRSGLVVNLVNGAGVWNGMVDGKTPLRPVEPAGHGQVEMQMSRQVVPLLRLRREAGTKVAHTGSATIDGKQFEQVRIVRGAGDVTLNIDPGTGRVHSVTFVGRNFQAEFGKVLITFSDYRDVGGVLVPFTDKGFFDGAPAENYSRTLDAADVNVALDAALFVQDGTR